MFGRLDDILTLKLTWRKNIKQISNGKLYHKFRVNLQKKKKRKNVLGLERNLGELGGGVWGFCGRNFGVRVGRESRGAGVFGGVKFGWNLGNLWGGVGGGSLEVLNL